MISDPDKPKILVTSGEPAGIGPDLVIQLNQVNHKYDITVIADADLLTQRANQLSIPTSLFNIDEFKNGKKPSNSDLKIIDLKLKTKVTAGIPDTNNANYILEMLDIACHQCLTGNYAAIVTTPIQKSVINDAGISFTGHTEYLAEKCGAKYPVMLLSCPRLKVALVTTHLPVKEVPAAITADKLNKVLRIVHNDFINRFGINKPRIAVCGLNPHAGENGHLGKEEELIIKPVINKFNSDGHNVVGPIPADTAFRPEQIDQYDVFICMYHDQGLPVLKALGFGEAVNITLGLPIIRTSVDHGTALDLAGTGKAHIDSLMAAVDMAANLAKKGNQNLSNRNIDNAVTV